jgi:hypothetical protein
MIRLVDGAVVYPAYRFRVLFDSGLVVDVTATHDSADMRRLLLDANPGAGGIAAVVRTDTEPVGWYST